MAEPEEIITLVGLFFFKEECIRRTKRKRAGDPDSYKSFLKIIDQNFNELFILVRPYIEKKFEYARIFLG